MSYSLSFDSNANIPLCWRLSEYLRPFETKFYLISLEDNNALNAKELNHKDLPTIYKVIRVVKIILYITLIGIPIVFISNSIAKSISEKYRKEFETSKAINIYEKSIKYIKNFLVPTTNVNHEEINAYLIFFKLQFFLSNNSNSLLDPNNKNQLNEYLAKNRFEITKFAPIWDYKIKVQYPGFYHVLKLFPNLKELNLRGTKIKKLDIRNFKKLTTLNLSYNYIKIFDEKTFPLDRVENLEIDLRNNPRFATVDSIKQIKKNHFHRCKNVTILITFDNIKTFGNEMSLIRTKAAIEKDLNEYFNLKGQTNVIFKIN